MIFSYSLYIWANVQFKHRVYLTIAVLKFSPWRRTLRRTAPQAPCVFHIIPYHIADIVKCVILNCKQSGSEVPL